MRRTLDYVGLGGLIVVVLPDLADQRSTRRSRIGAACCCCRWRPPLVVMAVRLPRQPARPDPGHAADALDRGPFLRDLPVALPGHRVDHRSACRAASTCRAPRCRSPSPSFWPPCRGASSRSPSARADASPAADGVPWHRRIAARWTWVVSTAALACLALTVADHRRRGTGSVQHPARCRRLGAEAPAARSGQQAPARQPTPRSPRPRPSNALSGRGATSHHGAGQPWHSLHSDVPSRRRRRPRQHHPARVSDHLVVPVGRPHRRLHLGEPHLSELPARSRASAWTPSTPGSGRPTSTSRSGWDVDRRDHLGRRRTPTTLPSSWSPGLSRAAGCSPSAPTTPPTCTWALTSRLATRIETHDVGHRQPAGHVGQRQVAGGAPGPTRSPTCRSGTGPSCRPARTIRT